MAPRHSGLHTTRKFDGDLGSEVWLIPCTYSSGRPEVLLLQSWGRDVLLQGVIFRFCPGVLCLYEGYARGGDGAQKTRNSLSSYIDDGFTVVSTPTKCLRQSSLRALLLGALGAFLGIPKCQLTPDMLVNWLGFLIDSEEQMFKVSDSKLANVKDALEEMLQTPTTSFRKLAALAGKIVALSPEVLPAALYSRRFYQAMRGKSNWDTVFPTTDSLKGTAEFWLRNLDTFNGRRWWPRPIELRLEVDALGVGFGGTITTNRLVKTPFLGTFSELAQAHQSSTAREMRRYAAAVDAATKQLPNVVRGSSILLI
jgi:hypothetical protein